MRRLPLAWLFLVFLLVAPRLASAWTPPPLKGAVNDTAGKLSATEHASLEKEIADYRKRTTNEIVVFIIDSLGGETVEDVAYAAANTWGIGKKGKDNGVLLVIAPVEHKMRIETGKGIGDKLTDIESSHILRERVGPLLKLEKYSEAARAGVEAIEAALDGRPAPPIPSSIPSAAPPVTAVALKGPIHIYDLTGHIPQADLDAANARSTGGQWGNLAIVFTPSANSFDDGAQTVRDQWTDMVYPTVIVIGVSDRAVKLYSSYLWKHANTDEAIKRIREIVQNGSVDLSVVPPVSAVMFDIYGRPAPPGTTSTSWADYIPWAIGGGIGFVMILGIIQFFLKRRSGDSSSRSYGDSSGSSSDSHSSSSSSSFSSTYESSSSFSSSSSSSTSDTSSSGSSGGGGGSDYSGGGGSTGGGGSSDSW